MANKYQSNVRTYMARNVLWNSGHNPVIQYALNAPTAIQLTTNDKVLQFFKANWGSQAAWETKANFNIRRAGLFSNFADGLVMENDASRLSIELISVPFTIVEVTGTAVFTAGSNLITGTGLNALTSGASFIADDNTSIYLANVYTVYDVTPTSARLSDYAYINAATPKIYKLTFDITKTNTYPSMPITVLNTMYETEIFFDNSVSDNVTVPLLLGRVNIQGSSTNMCLYTKSIDVAFNTFPVSFDIMLEAEITPL